MINKSKFVEIINALKSADELQDKINELMKTAKENIQDDFMNAAGLMICHTDIVIELLGYMFDDIGEWISWFVFDTRYGKSHTEVTDNDGNVIADIKTAEDLYDFLTKEMKQ